MLSKYKLLLLISCACLMTTACQPEKQAPQVGADQAFLPEQNTEAAASSAIGQDDFSDLKAKKDEQCDTEAELKAKQLEKPAEVFKLQGGDADCTVK